VVNLTVQQMIQAFFKGLKDDSTWCFLYCSQVNGKLPYEVTIVDSHEDLAGSQSGSHSLRGLSRFISSVQYLYVSDIWIASYTVHSV
jgi:hypothetical protein